MKMQAVSVSKGDVIALPWGDDKAELTHVREGQMKLFIWTIPQEKHPPYHVVVLAHDINEARRWCLQEYGHSHPSFQKLLHFVMGYKPMVIEKTGGLRLHIDLTQTQEREEDEDD